MIEQWVNLDNKLQEFINAYDNEQYSFSVLYLFTITSFIIYYFNIYPILEAI